MMFYTYAHYTADTNELFYIGKGKGKRSGDRSNRNLWWQRKVEKHGFTHKVLAFWPSEQEAYDHEEFLIACFKDLGYKLVNLASGGGINSGWKHSEEFKKKIADFHKGKKKTPEAIEKLKQAKQGLKVKEETKAKISATLKGKYYGKNTSVLCTTTGMEYASVKEASKETGCFPSNIVKCCTGERKHSKGLSFSYKENK